jgi:hypothetical protein
MAESVALLVDDVLRGYPVRQWVLSLPIPLRLLLARYPSELSKVMQIIHRAISTHIINKAGFTTKQAKTGAVTLIQRFGSALNLNIHFHMLFLEGAISENSWGGTTFTRIKAPCHNDMVELVHTISHRIAKYLEKVGLVQRDMENSYLNLPIDDEDSLLQLQGASVSYRIAMGPQQGQKVFTLQTLPASNKGEYGQLANISGFSLHAGVFAPNSNLRAQVTASQRGKNSPKLNNQENSQSDKPYHARSMSWLAGTAQRLKRVFNIDIIECEKCQKHNVTIIAYIIEPAIIHKILSYLDKQDSAITGNNTRAPPLEALEQTAMFNDFTIQRDFDFAGAVTDA